MTNCKDISVFPLVGASDRVAPYYMINEMVRVAADKLCATPMYAYIPAHPESIEDAELFKRTSTYKNMQKLWDNIDLSIVGIGINLELDKGNRIGHPGENIKSGMVGDICTNYFNSKGEFIQNTDMLCATEHNLRKSKSVLAISGGIAKANAILGALSSGIITDLR